MNTPATLARVSLYWMLGQALLIVVVASAVPGGSSWLTLAGFVTPYYETNIFAIRLVRIPWTDPALFASLQTTVQMLVVALAGSAVVTFIKTNPWEHGVLRDSTPKGRDKPSAPAPAPAAPAPAAPAPAAPAPPAPAPPAIAAPPPGTPAPPVAQTQPPQTPPAAGPTPGPGLGP